MWVCAADILYYHIDYNRVCIESAAIGYSINRSRISNKRVRDAWARLKRNYFFLFFSTRRLIVLLKFLREYLYHQPSHTVPAHTLLIYLFFTIHNKLQFASFAYPCHFYSKSSIFLTIRIRVETRSCTQWEYNITVSQRRITDLSRVVWTPHTRVRIYS